jgi:hypothetical protein
MCNPRRITVTATRQLQEAWQTEVSRTVQLQTQVTGEARIRQPLDTSLGSTALRALETILANDGAWQEVEEGYRHNVSGGYIIYLVNEQALEIVASLSEEIQASAQETIRLEGVINQAIATEGQGMYYDDGWGGRTEAVGQKEAQTNAQRQLDQLSQEQLRQAQREAEAAIAASLETAAHNQAQSQLQAQAEQRRAILAAQARQHLDTVGLRCRQVFNAVLAQAYREAILAYARRQGAMNILCNEGDNIIEIEFNLSRE